MRKIYIAGPLYSESEKSFNLRIDEILRELGNETYLPQRDGGCVSEMPEMIGGVPKDDYVFRKDLQAMADCDVFLFLMDGRVPDEGACVALGNAWANGKTCVGYKTDARALTGGEDNLMIRKTLRRILRNETELKAFFAEK